MRPCSHPPRFIGGCGASAPRPFAALARSRCREGPGDHRTGVECADDIERRHQASSNPQEPADTHQQMRPA
jgi:hypothetical protein